MSGFHSWGHSKSECHWNICDRREPISVIVCVSACWYELLWRIVL